jgi:alkylation response protein AidB-like acyl-CoA dehydrogenase
VLTELYRGRLRWDLLRPFPAQPPDDRLAGDKAVAGITDLLRSRVDPTRVDETGVLPDGLIDALQDGGFYRMLLDPALGGLALSPFNALRVVVAAASWSPAVAWSVSIGNGLGSGSFLPILPAGALRDLVTAKVRAGLVSGGADTETNGAANHRRHTTATPIEGGAAYLLNGEKVFIGNGPLAELLDVSATVSLDGAEQVRLFFVDTGTPGCSVSSRQEFLGLKGAPVGVLRFENVRVPAERMLDASTDEWRYAPEIARVATLARTLIICSAALAIARLGLVWSREFVNRRTMDDRPLGDYEQIQRIVARTAADVFTIESVLEWGLLGEDRADTQPDLAAAKNLASVTCWRVIDRTVGLLGGEGVETARSKARRGAAPLPVERFLRDARALRIAGGVDFLLDYWSAEAGLGTWYTAGPSTPDDATTPDGALSVRCQEHQRYLAGEAAAFGALCGRLTGRHPQQELLGREHTVIQVGRIGTALLGMAVVLARAAHLAEQGDRSALDLADIACTEARRTVAACWPALPGAAEPDYAGTSAAWLRGDRLDWLTSDVITDIPPIGEGAPDA